MWGILICGMLYVCLFLVTYRVLQICGETKKIIIIVAVVLYMMAAIQGMLFFTFTITGAICAATGVFLLITRRNKYEWKSSIVSIILLLISFCIRKDTFFMAFPFYCLWRMWELIDNYSKKKILYIVRVTALLIGICALLYGSHLYAFSNEDWKNFLEFRNAREAVHDYAGYPSWDSAEELYQSLGISYEEYAVVGTTGVGGVNTALDLSIDVKDILENVKEWNQLQEDKITFQEKIKMAFQKMKSCWSEINTIVLLFLIFLQIIIGLDYGIHKKWKLAGLSVMSSILFASEII